MKTAMYVELHQISETMRKRAWEPRKAELDSISRRFGDMALYELGRIVGRAQLAESFDRAVRDGWDPCPPGGSASTHESEGTP